MRYFMVQFMRKPGGQIDEQVTVSKRLKSSDQQTCNIIVDYKERSVVKAVIEGTVLDTDFERMDAYYRQVYPVIIGQLEKQNNPPPEGGVVSQPE